MPTFQAIGQFALTVGLGSIILAGLNAFFSRGQRKADPAKTLADASGEWVERVNKANEKLTTELATVERELDEEKALRRRRDREIRRMNNLIEEHAEWDRIVLRRLNDAGIGDIPDPPVLQHGEGED